MSANYHDPRLPLILALCTSNEHCSVALGQPGRAALSIELPPQPGGSGRILALTSELLAQRGRTLNHVAAIAFDQGPGAFTGLRVGCAAAQGLSLALQRPLLPINALAATAWQAYCCGGANGSRKSCATVTATSAGSTSSASVSATSSSTIIVANDARMNEVYLAIYRSAGDAIVQCLLPAQVLAADRAASALDQFFATAIVGTPDIANATIAAGDGFAHYPLLVDWARQRQFATEADCRSRADAILELAFGDYRTGRGVSAHDAAPLYIRDKVALDVDEQRVARGQ